MTTFNIGARVRFSPAVLRRTENAGASAVGVVVGWSGVAAVRVDFQGTWELHENGSTVRTVPRKNLVIARSAS
jgi:hypothetical protein